MKYRLAIYCNALLTTILLSTCSPKSNFAETENGQALVSVGEKTLYKQELERATPEASNTIDSTLAAEAYMKMWIKNELMYEKAKENLTDKEKIDELVENYRHSLTIYTYQEQLLRERLSKGITDKEFKDYFDSNPERFKLEADIIKGLFLKVPQTSPRLEDLKRWYTLSNDEAIENIEKFSLENAVIYDYFYDKWVYFDDILANIPNDINSPERFLKEQKRLEVQDSAYVYLLNIKEYALTGNAAPFEFAKGQIFDILLSQKRESFMKEFEDDLYKKAIDDGKIKFHVK